MAVLILGVALWWGAHVFKRLAPERRAAMGDPGKGLVAVLLFASVAAMVFGYRWAEGPVLWGRAAWSVGINNLAMLVALVLYVASNTGGWVQNRMRHPQLIAFKIWAVAHLLVNGELKAIVLFGSLHAWSIVQLIVINRSQDWAPGPAGSLLRDAGGALVAVALYAVITWVHVWAGLSPFGA